MQLSEREIEDYVFEDLVSNRGLLLSKRGFTTVSTDVTDFTGEAFGAKCRWVRQLNLGAYGICDLVGYFRTGEIINIELIELKAVPINVDDFEQICRYKSGIEQYLGARFALNFNLYLVGRGFDSGRFLQNELRIRVVEYEYGLDGIWFETHTGGWRKTGSDSFNLIKSIKNAEKIY